MDRTGDTSNRKRAVDGLLSCHLLNSKGEEITTDVLKDHLICLYIGAIWSPPSNAFLNEFMHVYNASETSTFVVVHVDLSSEFDLQSLKSLDGFKGACYSLPPQHPMITYLKLKHNVSLIPKLAIIPKFFKSRIE